MIFAFRFGLIPVRVHIWLLVAALVVGFGVHRGAIGVPLWAGAFLFTAFAHELAHAVAARSFGVPAEVQLTLFQGGLASRNMSLPPLRKMVVCIAGPAMSLLIGAMTFGIVRAHPPAREMVAGLLRYLGWMNLGWGLINLLPILPLDMGHALVAVLDRVTKGGGEQPVRLVSSGFAVVLGLVAVHFRLMFPAFICGLVAFQNVQASRARRAATNGESIMRVHLRAAFDAIERGEAALAIRHCRTVLSAPIGSVMYKDAVRILAYAYATTEAWGQLMELLESGGVRALEDGELEKYELAARELGRSADARRIAFLRNRAA